MERISRRDFLKAMLATGGSLLFGRVYQYIDRRDPVFKIEKASDNELGFYELAQLSIRFDRALDKLPKIPPQATPEGLMKYAREVYPQYSFEGIASDFEFPQKVIFEYYKDGTRANGVAGQSDCETTIWVNDRMSNDVSVMYQDDNLVSTVTHEMAHIAQGEMCVPAQKAFIENSAQIAALEIMAALGNAGNKEFFRACLNEMRKMAINAAYAAALKEDKLKEFEVLRSILSPGAISQSAFEKRLRTYEKRQSDLKEILDIYYLTPINMIYEAISKNGDELKLAFPGVAYINGFWLRTYKPEGVTVKLNDLHYLIDNLEGMTADFARR